jgi:hypothetical protein
MSQKINKSRKNKITRRYKKSLQGGTRYLNIKNEDDLLDSWKDNRVNVWTASDGMGIKESYFKDNMIMGDMTYDHLKQKLTYFFRNINNKEAFIKGLII